MGTTFGTSGIDWSTVASNSNSSSTAGFDVTTIVNEVIQADRQPETLWQTQETTFKNQTSALQQLSTQIQNLQKTVNALKDPLGSFDAATTSVSNASALSATAANGAAIGNHSISITSLATTSSYYSDQVASSSTPLGTGTISIQVGSGSPTAITVDNTDNTLTGLAAAINSQNLGVTANVITDAGGARLTLVSSSSGAAGNITITGNTTGLNLNLGSKGVNAALFVDGVPIDSSSNTVKNVIPGVTLNLLSPTSSPVSLQVNSNTSEATTAINDFVSAYNAVVSSINSQNSYSATSRTAGTLMGDSSVELVQSTLLADAATSVTGNGAITTLASLGITMADDGTLTVDNSKLTSALTSNFQGVQSFFQTATTGFAQKLASDLTILTDPVNSPITLDLNGINAQISSLQTQIANFDANLLTQKQTLITYYSNLNSTLQSLPSLLSSINAQLGSLKMS